MHFSVAKPHDRASGVGQSHPTSETNGRAGQQTGALAHCVPARQRPGGRPSSSSSGRLPKLVAMAHAPTLPRLEEHGPLRPHLQPGPREVLVVVGIRTIRLSDEGPPPPCSLPLPNPSRCPPTPRLLQGGSLDGCMTPLLHSLLSSSSCLCVGRR